MTVSNPNSVAQYTGNGSSTVFGLTASGNPIPFFAAGDWSVNLFDTSANANVTPQPMLGGAGTFDYTIVTLSTDPFTGELTGNIAFNTAPVANYRITATRAVPPTASNNFLDNAKFPSVSVNAALDRTTMLAGQSLAAFGRALQFPSSDPLTISASLPPQMLRANLYLGFDAQGQPVALAPPAGTSTVSSFMATLLTSVSAGAAMATLGAPNNVVVHPAGSAPVSQGHVIPWLDQNWLMTGDFYAITSSDPYAVPTRATITGVPAAGDVITWTISLDIGSSPQIVSYTVQIGDAGDRDKVATGLINALNNNAALQAQHLIALKDTGLGALTVGSYWNNIPVFSGYTSSSTGVTVTPPVPLTTLNGAIGANATSMVVASNVLFPASGTFQILINQEVFNVTAGAGTNNWTVTPHYAGTTTAAHLNGANVFGIAALDAAPQFSLARAPVGRPGQANDIVAYEQRNGLDAAGTVHNVLVLQSQIVNATPGGFQGGYQLFVGNGASSTPCFLAANGFGLGTVALPPSLLGYGIYSTRTGGDYMIEGVSVVRKTGTPLILNPYAIGAKAAAGHGFSTKPTEVIWYLECLTAELGYGVGERIMGLAVGDAGAAAVNGFTVSADAATTYFQTSSAGTPLVINRSTNAAANITAANWKIVATPYL